MAEFGKERRAVERPDQGVVEMAWVMELRKFLIAALAIGRVRPEACQGLDEA